MRLFATSFLFMVTASTTYAGNWPQWRGPYFNGSTDETNLPVHWNQTENVEWTADLPGASAATPAVWEERVFISSTDSKRDTLKAMCFDRKNGRLLWQQDAAKGIRKDDRSTFSAPSPATDGKVVVFFYGNGDLITFDLDGKKLWSRNIQNDYGSFAFLWTFSSSPVLFDGKLFLQVLQRDVAVERYGFLKQSRGRDDGSTAGKGIESYLLAMDPRTGETLWRHVRPSEAVAESREAFTTPIPFESRGRKHLLIAGGDDLTAHDPATGKELWRWGTWNPDRIGHWRLVPSAVAGADTILVCAPKRDPIYAVNARGRLVWNSEQALDVSSDVPTPAFYDGDFFVLSDVRNCLSRVEPTTGQVKWTTSLPRGAKYEASPLAADGKIYAINFDADVVVVRAADGQLIHTVSMDAERTSDVVRSSIVAAHGQLLIRTNAKLYCVGQYAR